jgi:AraC family transcriptional regulator
MFQKILILPEKKLIGVKICMSFNENKVVELWKKFMPRRKEITSNLNNELISMQIYPNSFDLVNLNPNAKFDKWAAVEVTNFDNIPDEMEPYLLNSSLYAVFLHQGSNTDFSTFKYIFETWLPNSGYEIDNRPHFEILGANYKNNDVNSEEEVYIPIKLKINIS